MEHKEVNKDIHVYTVWKNIQILHTSWIHWLYIAYAKLEIVSFVYRESLCTTGLS